MAAASFLQYVRLAYFSKPASERPIYRAIRRLKAKSIIEMGVGMGERSKRLIQVAQRYSGDSQIRFTAVDLFEAREAHDPGWTVKRAHRVLTSHGAKVQVVPGDPFSALSRTANALKNVDLVVIGADQDDDSLAQAWFYVPRILHEGSRVFREVEDLKRGRPGFEVLDFNAVEQLAGGSTQEMRRAA